LGRPSGSRPCSRRYLRFIASVVYRVSLRIRIRGWYSKVCDVQLPCAVTQLRASLADVKVADLCEGDVSIACLFLRCPVLFLIWVLQLSPLKLFQHRASRNNAPICLAQCPAQEQGKPQSAHFVMIDINFSIRTSPRIVSNYAVSNRLSKKRQAAEAGAKLRLLLGSSGEERRRVSRSLVGLSCMGRCYATPWRKAARRGGPLSVFFSRDRGKELCPGTIRCRHIVCANSRGKTQ
jgi:hypothetical protein